MTTGSAWGRSGPTYSVGGTISGLTGTAVLENNAGNDLSLSANGAFTFSTALAGRLGLQRHGQDQPLGPDLHGHQPLGHHRRGQRHQRGGRLRDHGRAHLQRRGHHLGAHRHRGPREQRRQRPEPSANGAFTFSTALAGGSAYNVTVKTNPSGQTCTVTNPSGTIAAANVTNVAVSLRDHGRAHLHVGGTISGLTGTAVLENNAGNDLSTSANGAFTFSTALAGGSAYNVTVKTNPSGQTCTVTNPSGTIAAANVTNVAVSLRDHGRAHLHVGGTISGLTGTAVLENNAGNDLSTSANGAFTFSTALAQGSAYNVTVKTNPSGQTCTVTNPSGTIAAANVTNVAVSLRDHGRAHLHGRGHHLGAHRHRGPREQRRQRPEHQRQRRLHLQHRPWPRAPPTTSPSRPTPRGRSARSPTPRAPSPRPTSPTSRSACVTQTASGSVSDNFNRANGTLGTGWTAMSDGGMAISSQAVVGTKTAYSGDIRTGETYASDQSSQIEVTSTQLSGAQWIGAAVRAQNGGQNLYLGLYFWNNGNPELMLYKRISGSWTQLGGSSFQGALAPGTQLNLSVTGSNLSFSQNGVVRITATDTSLDRGRPRHHGLRRSQR